MEEWFEIVNEEGLVIGTAPRSKCHGDPSLAHRSVHVIVRNRSGEYFLQRRSRFKDVQPGKWDTSVGGHLSPGESYECAAVRELNEELGVVVTDPQRELVRRHDYVWRTEIETEHVRTFEFVSDGPFRLNPQEIDDGRFWDIEEIRDSMGKGAFTPNLEHEFHLLGVLERS